MSECDPDFEFVYADCDTHANELSELYSYTEGYEFLVNRSCFEELILQWNIGEKWIEMSEEEKVQIVERISEGIELSDRKKRFRFLRALLYIVQGVFDEAENQNDVLSQVRKNVFLVYKRNFFPILVQLLLMEVEEALNSGKACQPPLDMRDSADLRVILNILYTIIEVMRFQSDHDSVEEQGLRESLKEELSKPLSCSDELLALTLFQMVTKFCNGSAPHFPIKKILLLLWKTILITLGGLDDLKELKNYYRSRVNLPPIPDETLEVARTMRPASPPMSVDNPLEVSLTAQKRRRMRQKMMIKQDAMIGDEQDSDDTNETIEANEIDDPNETNGESEQMKDDFNGRDIVNGSNDKSVEEKIDTEPRPASPRSPKPKNEEEETDVNSEVSNACKGLPWWPKVRHKDIEIFLRQTRSKFIGFNISDDKETTAGFPVPILEGYQVLKKHLYVSLSELQTRREEEIAKYPLTIGELDTKPLYSSAEFLYVAILPSLPQNMIALLKILLAAAPASKTKTESLNIGSEILPEAPLSKVLESMKFALDFTRHKEIIIKAVSAIIILLLKHFKLNHIYQFENINQQLMYANCIPLILKIFNQNIFSYAMARNNISLLDYPTFVVSEPTELSEEKLAYDVSCRKESWRNMFSCINMVRILNKLTKWKYARIMMLVVYKSSPILKKALRIRHALFQLYVLKLLKIQAKYLGRQWRKTNMRILSSIYQMVRHRLTDDWAYGNELDSRPWDFQNDEFNLQANISRFHNRRYSKSTTMHMCPAQLQTSSHVASRLASNGFTSPFNESMHDDLLYSCQMELFNPVDNNFLSVLSRQYHLTREFKLNYESWLQREVFEFNINWDHLLVQTNTSDM